MLHKFYAQARYLDLSHWMCSKAHANTHASRTSNQSSHQKKSRLVLHDIVLGLAYIVFNVRRGLWWSQKALVDHMGTARLCWLDLKLGQTWICKLNPFSLLKPPLGPEINITRRASLAQASRTHQHRHTQQKFHSSLAGAFWKPAESLPSICLFIFIGFCVELVELV